MQEEHPPQQENSHAEWLESERRVTKHERALLENIGKRRTDAARAADLLGADEKLVPILAPAERYFIGRNGNMWHPKEIDLRDREVVVDGEAVANVMGWSLVCPFGDAWFVEATIWPRDASGDRVSNGFTDDPPTYDCRFSATTIMVNGVVVREQPDRDFVFREPVTRWRQVPADLES